MTWTSGIFFVKIEREDTHNCATCSIQEYLTRSFFSTPFFPPSDDTLFFALTRYCQCFAGQLLCSESCKCENCYNSTSHEIERRTAVRELLCRSPHAFDAKICKTMVRGALRVFVFDHSVGVSVRINFMCNQQMFDTCRTWKKLQVSQLLICVNRTTVFSSLLPWRMISISRRTHTLPPPFHSIMTSEPCPNPTPAT